MSLGAIDFGLIIDGAVVMVENIVRHLGERQRALGRRLNARERSVECCAQQRGSQSDVFWRSHHHGCLCAHLGSEGIEGKMFKPMAVVVMLALGGSLVLALTLMPVLCSYLLGGKIQEKDSRIVSWMKRVYLPLLNFGVRHRWLVVVPMLGLFAFSLVIFTRLGAEFIPPARRDRSNSSAAAARHFLLTQLAAGKRESAAGELSRNSRNLLADWHEKSPPTRWGRTSRTRMSCSSHARWRKIDGKTVAKADLGALMRDTLLAHVPGSKYPGHSTHSAAFQRNHGRRPRRPDVQDLRRQL